MKRQADLWRWPAIVIALSVVAFWLLGPYEEVVLTPASEAATVGPDLDAHFAEVEGRFDDITPGVQKRVVWAGAPGDRTDWSVLYVHGFSATSEEIRPVPDRVADALGANLFFTRLTGHGQDGDAMAKATVQDWMNDLAEGLAAARIGGRNVVVIATSTGATLVAAAALDPDLMQDVRGVVLVSPNFGIRNPWAALLTWPAARHWIATVAGETRSFVPRNQDQATYWTTEYPTVATLPMAALVRKVVAMDFTEALVPALFYFAPEDAVVDSAITDGIAAIWGTAHGIAFASVFNPALGPEDDPARHVIAGDIMSPGQTDAAVERILEWMETL